jgi:mono/diheme cytochrome c family protein
MRVYYFLFFLPALFFSCGGNTSRKPEPTGPISGKDIYNANCVTCHGDDGKKGTLGAADLSKSMMDKKTQFVTIKDGKGAMAPMKAVMADQEIYAVIEFLETLKK